MPLLNPDIGESRDDFMTRCMTQMEAEFSDFDQRLAVCSTQFEDRSNNKMKKYSSFKGTVIKEKIEQKSFIMGKPNFETSVIGIGDIPVNPNLIGAFKVLTEEDKDPYFFISEMKFGEDHITEYDDIMTVEWSESFVNKLDNAPFPLSTLGHVNVEKPYERAESQGYVFGGLVDKERESMFLLNYLLPGKTESEKALFSKTVREMKAKMLSTSISNMQRYVLAKDEETNDTKWYVVESLNGQRNDIVEHDLTGADAAIVARSLKSKADKATAENTNKKGDSMEKKEMLEKLQTLKANGDLKVTDLADAFGLELITDPIKNDLAVLKSVREIVGDGDVIETITGYKKTADRVENLDFEENKAAALKDVFKDKDSLLDNAKELFTLKAGNKADCLKEAKRVSELKTLKDLASRMAADMSKGITPAGSSSAKSNSDVIEM